MCIMQAKGQLPVCTPAAARYLGGLALEWQAFWWRNCYSVCLLAVDTVATHQWHFLPGLTRLKPSGGDNPTPHRWLSPPTPEKTMLTQGSNGAMISVQM